MAKKRPIGQFKIDRDDIEENPEAVRAIMGTVIPIRAEMMFASNRIEYIALCDDFEEIEDGTEPPWYEIEGIEEKDGEVEVTWVKQ